MGDRNWRCLGNRGHRVPEVQLHSPLEEGEGNAKYFGDRVTGITVHETKGIFIHLGFNNLLLCLNKLPTPRAYKKSSACLLTNVWKMQKYLKKRSSVIPPAQHFDLSTF